MSSNHFIKSFLLLFHYVIKCFTMIQHNVLSDLINSNWVCNRMSADIRRQSVEVKYVSSYEGEVERR